MIAGLPPVYGFYTAMLTPIIAALFGSSYHLVSGPTTTSSIVLYAIVSKFITPNSDIEAFISLAILFIFLLCEFQDSSASSSFVFTLFTGLFTDPWLTSDDAGALAAWMTPPPSLS